MRKPPQSLIDIMQSYACVAAGYLFGSVARGTALPWSDVDIALVFQTESPPGERLRAATAIAEVAEREFERVCVPVDLVEQGLLFQHQVLLTGPLLFVRNRRAHARFVARVLLEALDFLPTYRIFERGQAHYIRRLAGR